MKQRLSKDEYLELGRKIKSVREACLVIFHMMTGHFPKNSKAIKSLMKTDSALLDLYYSVETEFLHDFPNEEVTAYGKQKQ